MKRVAVVGAGIGGLAIATLLAEQGDEVVVYEQAPSPKPVGAGFLLQPPGQRVLAHLGVLNDIANVSIPINSLQSKTINGQTLLDLKYANLKGKQRQGLGVQRSTIHKALLQRAHQNKTIEFVWGEEVTSCQNLNDRVCVQTPNEKAMYDFCILSSGASSDLAQSHFPKRIKRPYGWGCLWTTMSLPPSLASDVLHQRCYQAENMMGILPVKKTEHGIEAALYWSMPSSQLTQLNTARFRPVLQEMKSFWPAAEMSLSALNFSDFIAAHYHDVWTPTPYHGRIVAIGDVCHGTSPQLGQGCTMALLDALSLANTIEQYSLSPKALQIWWKSRRAQLFYVRHLSRILTPLFQSNSVVCAKARDWIMAPVGRLSMFQQLQLRTLASDIFLPTPLG